jgi:hypothetical protein
LRRSTCCVGRFATMGAGGGRFKVSAMGEY